MGINMRIELVGMSPKALRRASPHQHDTWEIVLNLEGNGVTVINGREYNFFPGSIICHPPGAVHSKYSDDPFTDIFVQVDGLIPPQSGEVSLFTDEEEKSFEALMFLALRTFYKKSGNYKAVLGSLAETMNQVLISWSAYKDHNESVENLKNTLIENFMNPEFKIGDAMGNVSYNTDYFRRCFKKETGKSPSSFITDLRMDYAEKLLSQQAYNKMTISEIALMSGFYDPRYFSRVFKKHYGTAPNEYIKKDKEPI